MQSVDWIIILGAPAWQLLGEYVTLDGMFYNLLSKQETAATPNYFQIFFPIALLEEAFIRNII